MFPAFPHAAAARATVSASRTLHAIIVRLYLRDAPLSASGRSQVARWRNLVRASPCPHMSKDTFRPSLRSFPPTYGFLQNPLAIAVRLKDAFVDHGDLRVAVRSMSLSRVCLTPGNAPSCHAFAPARTPTPSFRVVLRLFHVLRRCVQRLRNACAVYRVRGGHGTAAGRHRGKTLRGCSP